MHFLKKLIYNLHGCCDEYNVTKHNVNPKYVRSVPAKTKKMPRLILAWQNMRESAQILG